MYAHSFLPLNQSVCSHKAETEQKKEKEKKEESFQQRLPHKGSIADETFITCHNVDACWFPVDEALAAGRCSDVH